MTKIKNWFAIFLLSNGICGYAMTPDEAKAFYKDAYEHTVLNMQSTKKDYAKYFSKNFVMQMNGKTYHFDEYVQFMLDLKKDRSSVDINFKNMVAESNQVATAHVTHIIMKNGKEIYLNALSLFKIQNHKFITGKELIQLQS